MPRAHIKKVKSNLEKKSGGRERYNERKKLEAGARQIIWNAMSPKEQLESLDEKGVAATKQRAKLATILKAGK